MLFPCYGNEAKRGVEFRFSIRNAFKTWRKVGNRSTYHAMYGIQREVQTKKKQKYFTKNL